MKINYYQDTDSLYISLSDNKATNTREIVEGLNVDLDSNGYITGIDIDQAKKFVDLVRIETGNPPFKSSKLG